jgi:hypothetical protein
MAAVGSGNLTLAGWQSNAELWTVLRGDTRKCPAAFGDLARWLRGLPGDVRFSWGIPAALERVADELEALLESSAERVDLGVRLVSTSTGRILEQLPLGPVDELAVCAPFHDPGASALRALCERMQPQRLLVSYQAGYAQIDGPSLAELIDERKAELWLDSESRYRHGKLIEWVVGGQRFALTGSPNLSSAALLSGLDDGGNCEVGLITPIDHTLLPEGAPVASAAVRAVKFNVRARKVSGPLLLGATRVEQGLLVLFARTLSNAGYLELSHAAMPPETWERVADVAAGITEVTVTFAADGGSRIRLVTTSQDGALRYSNSVPVVDPGRALRRPGITAAHAPATRADELFDDPRLAERFFADLATLRTGLPTQPKASSVGGGERQAKDAPSASIHDRDNWERYLDECAARIGHPLLRFALGLPTPPGETAAAYDALQRTSWDEQFTDDTEIGLDDDDAEAVAEERKDDTAPAQPLTLPDLRRGVSESVRRRYRRWAGRLTNAAERLGTPERMLVTRLLLWAVAAGAWDRDDHSWVALLAESLCVLGKADLPAEAEPQVASLAAVALSVLRTAAPRYVYAEETLAYETAAQSVAYLLPAVDPIYVDEYRQLLDEAFGSAVNPETVQNCAAEVIQADPVADAVWALAENGRDAHLHEGRLLHVVGKFGNPILAAIETVGAAQKASIVGAWATSVSGRWALCMWRKPDLITIDGSGPVPLWRHYQLTGLVNPQGLAKQKGFEGAASIPHGPFTKPFPEAMALLDQLGLTSADPPDDCTNLEC